MKLISANAILELLQTLPSHPESRNILSREQFSELTDRLCSELRMAIADALNPRKDRAGAAAYLNVSVDFIDVMKRRGKLTPEYVGTKPQYHITQLDKLRTPFSKGRCGSHPD